MEHDQLNIVHHQLNWRHVAPTQQSTAQVASFLPRCALHGQAQWVEVEILPGKGLGFGARAASFRAMKSCGINTIGATKCMKN